MSRTSLALLALALGASAFAQSVSLSVVHDACGGGNGSVTAAITGGTPPYSVLWSTGLASSGDTLDLSIMGLFAGTYDITVTDDLGSVFGASAAVLNLPSLQVNWPTAMTVTTCDGGCTLTNLELPLGSGTAGGPYGVNGVAPGTASTSSNWLTLTALCAGQTYDVVVSDALGCTAEIQITAVDEPSPNLLLQSITGSCAGDENGSATFQFDMPVSLGLVYGPPPTSTVVTSYPTPGQVQLDGLSVGTYEFYATPTPNTTCHDTILLVVPSLPAGCGTVSGTAYADLDGDCVQDSGEPGLPHRMITFGPTGDYTMTNGQGQYTRGMPLGAYTADITAPGFAPNCPVSLPAPFTLTAIQPDAQLDIALSFASGADGASYLATTCHAPGFQSIYMAQAVNNGPFTLTDLTIEVSYDVQLGFVWADSLPIAQIPGYISWSIPVLPPFTTWDYSFILQLPPNPGLIGTLLSAMSDLIGLVADADPSNNTYAIGSIVVGAYDPNDKVARTSTTVSSTLFVSTLDEHIDYTIRFQNTGNGPAQHVFLIDTIAPELDLGSFEFLGSSHAMEVLLLPERVLRFDFPGIMLPDSASDQAGSHGFARFRLRPVDPIPGSFLRNAADIYFDFNPPIRTAGSVLDVVVDTQVAARDGSSFEIVPNPAAGRLSITGLKAEAYELTWIDHLGRAIRIELVRGPLALIDASDLASGTYVIKLKDRQGAVMYERCLLE